MNGEYDHDGARLCLNSLIARCGQGVDVGANGAIPLWKLNMEKIFVQTFEEPETLRLTHGSIENGEEICVQIPGVLCQKNLPPFLGNAPTELKHIRKLRQYVKLTGLGSPLFNDFENQMKDIYDAFSKKVAPATVQPLHFQVHEGEYAIDLHCRYFTDRKDAPGMKHQPFQPGVDPLHRLDEARRDVFIHGEENVVQYCQVITDGEMNVRYERLPPQQFEVGDIVEATVSFVCYPLYPEGYVIRPTLRALTLQTSEIREAAKARRAQEVATLEGRSPPGKRKRETITEQGHNRGRRTVKRRFINLE